MPCLCGTEHWRGLRFGSLVRLLKRRPTRSSEALFRSFLVRYHTQAWVARPNQRCLTKSRGWAGDRSANSNWWLSPELCFGCPLVDASA